MNIYLLELIGKWINLLFVSIISIIGSFSLNDITFINDNNTKEKSLSIINTVIPYQTIIERKSNIPLNISKVITEGQDGIVFKNENEEIVQVYQEKIDKVIQVGIGPKGNYTGRMTAYGPDCKTCNGIGDVACPTKDKKTYNLIKDGIYYNDTDFGKVRILAATKEVFNCGTIVEVNKKGEKFLGIVLDRGSAMERAWSNEEKIVIDLAFETEKNPEVLKTTSNDVDYNVQRWGW